MNLQGILEDPAMEEVESDFQNINTMKFLASYKENLEGLRKSIPKALAWGILSAFKEKYGSEYKVFNIKKAFPLFNPDGQPLWEDKINKVRVFNTSGRSLWKDKIEKIKKVCKPSWVHGSVVSKLLNQQYQYRDLNYFNTTYYEQKFR